MTEPLNLREMERELRTTELTCRAASYDETRPGQIALALIALVREARRLLQLDTDGHEVSLHPCGKCAWLANVKDEVSS